MAARSENQRAMARAEKIDTDALSGGVFPRQIFDEWVEDVQEEAIELDMVRVETLDFHQTQIPKMGVGERLMREQGEGAEAPDYQEVDTGKVDLDVVKTVVPFKLTRESVEDVVEREGVADRVIGFFERQFAVDAAELGWIGDEADADDFVGINDGWLKIAETGDAERLNADPMPSYDHELAGINTDMFNSAILAIEQKYLRTDPVFWVSRRNLQRYMNELTEREDGIGVAVLQGDVDITPFDFDIVSTSLLPDDTALFTAPENLIWAIRRDVELDVLTESDEIQAEDLFAKWMLRARHDYQIENLQAGVLIENIE